MTAICDAFLTAVDSVADLLGRPEVAAAWETPSALAEWSVPVRWLRRSRSDRHETPCVFTGLIGHRVS